jgi:hypothetical protein
MATPIRGRKPTSVEVNYDLYGTTKRYLRFKAEEDNPTGIVGDLYIPLASGLAEGHDRISIEIKFPQPTDK